jgi:hypothetical protein
LTGRVAGVARLLHPGAAPRDAAQCAALIAPYGLPDAAGSIPGGMDSGLAARSGQPDLAVPRNEIVSTTPIREREIPCYDEKIPCSCKKIRCSFMLRELGCKPLIYLID